MRALARSAALLFTLLLAGTAAAQDEARPESMEIGLSTDSVSITSDFTGADLTIFGALDNAWGRRGWTCATLAALSEAELKAALEMAWRHAAPKAKTGKQR